MIREPVQQLFETVLAKLIEVKDQLLGALADAINSALAAIREKLRSLDPQALVVGLGNLFALIHQTLEALDLAGLLDGLTAAFDRLRTDLNTALQDSLDAFTLMVEAIPV